MESAIKAIAAVHGDGKLPTIPVEQSARTRRLGAFFYKRLTFKPLKIEVSSRGPNPGLTSVHEIGHFLEKAAIPKTQGGARIYSLTPELKGWLDAIQASQAIADLKVLRGKPTAQLTQADGTKVTYKVDRRYVSYLLQHDEIWPEAMPSTSRSRAVTRRS